MYNTNGVNTPLAINLTNNTRNYEYFLHVALQLCHHRTPPGLVLKKYRKRQREHSRLRAQNWTAAWWNLFSRVSSCSPYCMAKVTKNVRTRVAPHSPTPSIRHLHLAHRIPCMRFRDCMPSLYSSSSALDSVSHHSPLSLFKAALIRTHMRTHMNTPTFMTSSPL